MTEISKGKEADPRISVVMPHHNDAKYVGWAIESILAQTCRSDESLILDDASTDNSVAVIEDFATRYSMIRFMRSGTNPGVNAAHRRLFEAATGESDREIGVLSYRGWTKPTYAEPPRFRDEMLRVEAPSNSITSSTVFLRDAFAEVGYYSDELESWGDTFSAIAIGLQHGVAYMPERWSICRKMPSSYSQPAPGASFFTRYRHRLPRTLQAIALARYRPSK